MGVVTSFKIRKSINLLLSSPDINSDQVLKAKKHLKDVGYSSIPKLLDAIYINHDSVVILDLLNILVCDNTLDLYIQELSSSDPLHIKIITKILSDSKNYNPNNLIEYCEDTKLSKLALTRILSHHKARITPRAIEKLLSRMDKNSRTSVLQFVEQAATEAMLPVIVPWAQAEDWITRLSIARILGRFPLPEGEKALVQLLADTHKSVRQTALEGLISLNNPAHVGAICKLIRDMDLSVQNKAIEAVISMCTPQTVPHLLELLQDESEYVRRGAVEVLNAVADTSAIKALLDVLRDKDWWVRVRAADALGTIGGTAVVEAVLDLIQDEDPFIRRSAVEILNTTSDERAFDALTHAVADTDWWVRERAIDALAQLGDTRAISVLIPLLNTDVETSRVAIRAVGTIGEPSSVLPLLDCLYSTDHGVVKETLQVLSTLTSKPHAADVQQHIFDLTQHTDASVRELAKSTLNALKQRLGDRIGTLSSTMSSSLRRPPTTSHVGTVNPSSILDINPAQDQVMVRLGESGEASLSLLDFGALEPGMVLKDRYRIIRHVGKGAFGSALLVEDTAVHEEIVLKFLHAHLAETEQAIKRFIRELRYARRITHENVIRIFDFLTFGESNAISMEYFESHALSAYLQSKVKIAPRTSLKLIRSICNGMAVAHRAEVIHRDLKPANILVNQEGLLKIVDFGLAAAADHEDSRVTRSGAMVGTPAYMSPEQIRGDELDIRTDIYSLGVIMYEMFTGRQPYSGKDTVSVIYQHIQGELTPPRQLNPNISPEIEALIVKAMAAETKNRYQSMDEMRIVLDQLERL